MSVLRLQTVERDCCFRRLDFRPKLVLMAAISATAFVWESPLMGGLLALFVVLASLAAGVKFRYVRLVCTVMLPFYILLLATHGFFNVEQVQALTGRTSLTPLFQLPRAWWLVGGATMSVEGVLYGLNAIFKTLTLTLIIPLGIFTTDVDRFIVGLVRARVPYRLAFIFSATLRFVPLLFEEIRAIIEAQRLRGLALERMGLIARVRVYAKVAVPLILGALVKSQMLEVVLQAKAFTGNPDRTYLHESTMGPQDYLVIVLSGLAFLVAMVAYIWLGVGKFGGPV